MRQRRLTQLELGKTLGISHTSVGRWLAGSVPHKRTVAQLAEYFGVTVEALLNESPLPGEVTAEERPEVGEAPAPISPDVLGAILAELKAIRAHQSEMTEHVTAMTEQQEAIQRELEALKMVRRVGDPGRKSA
jgi:transcriptional regulator with XRE-family HTH domain